MTSSASALGGLKLEFVVLAHSHILRRFQVHVFVSFFVFRNWRKEWKPPKSMTIARLMQQRDVVAHVCIH